MTDNTKKSTGPSKYQMQLLEIAASYPTEHAAVDAILDWRQGMDDRVTRADIRRDLAAARAAEAQEAE